MNAKEAFAILRRPPKGLYGPITNLDPPPRTFAEAEEEQSAEVQPTESGSIQNSPTRPGLSDWDLMDEESDDDGDANVDVHEGKISLLPACINHHGKFKGKDNEGEPRRCERRARTCGDFILCDECIIVPSSEGKQDFRLTTSDPEHDLKRWLTTPNSRLEGHEASRTVQFLREQRFSYADLHEAMTFAIQEVMSEHEHIASLEECSQRFPYHLNIHIPVATKANTAYFSMKPEHFDSVPLEGLEDDLVEAAKELDYLRAVADWLGKKILDAKVRAAKLGNWSEITELLRLGVITKGWMQNNCLNI